MINCHCRNTPGLEEIVTHNGIWGGTVVLKGKWRKDEHEVSMQYKEKESHEPSVFLLNKNGRW